MAAQAQRHPTLEQARELFEWRPDLGVLSIYLRIDPGDRSAAWRTELRNGLAAAVEGAKDSEHHPRLALRRTADQVAARLGEGESHSLPRGEFGFVEIAREPARERWWSSHLAPRSPACVYAGGRPVLVPFLRLAARSRPRGVALVSAERVRLLEWEPGHLEELHSFELTLASADWRERDGEWLAENRHRFLRESGGRAAEDAVERGWGEVIAFSPPQYVGHFREAFASTAPDFALGGEADLIAESVGRLLEPVEAAAERRDAEADRRLVERALEETRGGSHGAAGAQETLAALVEGRVDHLIVDDSRGSEPLARHALATGARITPVGGDAAELLAPSDGVAALLRY